MRHLVVAVTVLLLLGSTAYGGWYVGPRVVYGYPYAYPAPMVVAPPYVVYSPLVPAPVLAPAPVWVAPPGVIVRPKVYVPGRPVRNAIRAAVP